MEIEKTSQENTDLQQYTMARAFAHQLLDAIHGLEAMQTRWNSLDSLNTMIPGEGVHLGLTRVELGAVIFDTANAARALLDAGHGTNLSKLL